MTLDELCEAVSLMRRLGVSRWGDIELGPDVLPTEDPGSPLEVRKSEVDSHRVKFGASGGPRAKTSKR